MELITRTVYGAALQTSQFLNRPVVIKPNSTLNEKFSIHENIQISDLDIPSVYLMTIGNKGHKMVVGQDNIYIPKPVPHTPRHAALYNHIPFVLRLLANDLNATQRANYRLRRIETHDGQQYAAYYAKVLDLASVVPTMELRSVSNGVTTSTPFVPSQADLSPEQPPITANSVLLTTGDYIAATAKVPFNLTSGDMDELLNVANILYGDESYAIISELGLCSGVDKAVTGEFNGVSTGYTDAIGVQIVSHIGTWISSVFNKSGVSINLDTGNVEPLLTLTNQT